MKTAIELIAKERKEQIKKHGRTVELDVQQNHNCQLLVGAVRLIQDKGETPPPDRWDKNIWKKMQSKSKKKRLIIAGALIAAELDRLRYEKTTR